MHTAHSNSPDLHLVTSTVIVKVTSIQFTLGNNSEPLLALVNPRSLSLDAPEIIKDLPALLCPSSP